MSDEEEDPSDAYSLDEQYVRRMLKRASSQFDIISDLLAIETQKVPLNSRIITLLCDSFSSNYHLWKVLKVNLEINLVNDKKAKENYILLADKDIFMLEQSLIAKTFTANELAQLNYSLKIH